MANQKHHLVYQITNRINNKIYIGIHSTENIDDEYLGSGTQIRRAVEKYGIENFKKEILFDFDNPEEMILKESELVDRKFIARKDVYNIKTGGVGWNCLDTISVRDNDGNCFRVHKSDERWINSELFGVSSNLVTVKDCEGNIFSISNKDSRFLSGELISIQKGIARGKDLDGNKVTTIAGDNRFRTGELVGHTKGTVIVKDHVGNNFRVSVDDERWISGEVFHPAKGRVIVCDSEGNIYSVYKNDPRYVSGELKSTFTGKIPVKDSLGNHYLVSKNDPRYISGELVSMHLGNKLSQETRDKISNNQPPKTEEHLQNISNANKGQIPVRDDFGNVFRVTKSDPRWISGEVTALSKGRKHKNK